MRCVGVELELSVTSLLSCWLSEYSNYPLILPIAQQSFVINYTDKQRRAISPHRQPAVSQQLWVNRANRAETEASLFVWTLSLSHTFYRSAFAQCGLSSAAHSRQVISKLL